MGKDAYAPVPATTGGAAALLYAVAGRTEIDPWSELRTSAKHGPPMGESAARFIE